MLIHVARTLPHARSLVLLAIALLPLALATAAHADTTVRFDGTTGRLTVIVDDAINHDMTIARDGSVLKVTDRTQDPVTFGSGCDNADGDATAECPLGIGPAPTVEASLGTGDDVVTLDGIAAYSLAGGDGADTLTGSALGDTIQGGAGNDSIYGGDATDLLYGDGGDDWIDGEGGADALDGGEGADRMYDTGGSAGDTVTYHASVTDPAGVEVSLDGVANDGNVAQDAGGTDNVDTGIDNVQGSRFADELVGGNGDDVLSGAEGDDRLDGGGGSDRFNGADGDDRIEARDGHVDADVDCDNSMGAHGTADVAVLDADDPAPRNCESVLRPGGGGSPGGDGGGAGGGGAAPPSSPGPAPGSPAGPSAPGPHGAALGAVTATAARVTMPDVVGRSMDAARRAVLAKVSGVDLDVQFQRGCKAAQDQEVVRQRPTKNTTIDTYEGADVPVRLYVCVAERDFLADCDLKDLKNDLQALPRRVDADLGLAVLGTFTKCKVDYDVKMTKKAEEARLALAAQQAAAAAAAPKAKDPKLAAKAQIQAAIDCPTAPEDQDLTITLTEGTAGAAGTMSLRESGPGGWTLPTGAGGFTSFVDVLVRDKSMPSHAVEATLYLDGDDVGIAASDLAYPKQSAQRTKTRGGYARLLLTPRKAGVIRLCAIYRTDDDQALTAAVQIRVAAPLKTGDTWRTVSGREFDITKNGPKEKLVKIAAAAPPRAHAAGLDEVWNWLVGLFGGTSASINAAAAGGGEARLGASKLGRVQGHWAPAQVSVDGTLDGEPVPPTVAQGPCTGFQKGGKVVDMICPQLMATGGSALLGMSTDGARVVANGQGNVFRHTGTQLVGAGAGNVLSHDGRAVLVGTDGATLVGTDGATLVGAGAGNAIGVAQAQLVGTDGATLIGTDGGTLIGTDGGTLVAAGAGNLVGAGGLN